MLRILLVESDEAVSHPVSRVLTESGHRVDGASTMHRARELLTTCAYERAILETWLPDGDGLALLDWIRTRAHPTDVLVLSANLEPSLTTRAFLLGARLVYKPAPLDVIRRFASEPSTVSALLRTARDFAVAHRLSPRQTDLLLHLVRGTPRKSLAPMLDVEENTVKTMVRQILEKTDTASLDELRCTLLERSAA
jgi:DNA-binding NarL/FixJ family response regulator